MKIRELDFFEEDIKQEFCSYLKQYFKEKCEVECPGINSISSYITFKDNENEPGNKVTVTVGNNCTIYLHNVSINICIIETDDRAEVVQKINLSGSVDFAIAINTKTGIKCTCTFSVDFAIAINTKTGIKCTCTFSVDYAELYDKLSALDIAKKNNAITA